MFVCLVGWLVGWLFGWLVGIVVRLCVLLFCFVIFVWYEVSGVARGPTGIPFLNDYRVPSMVAK